MINEFSVSPKPPNNKAKVYSLLLFLTGALIIVVSAGLDAYRGLVAVFSLVPFTLAILIYTKYISQKFVYEIFVDTDGEPLFIVRQTAGARSATLCRVALFTVESVEALSPVPKKTKDTERFVYCQTLFPKEVILIKISGYRAKSEILIEGNNEFLSLLQQYSQEARESHKNDDGE